MNHAATTASLTQVPYLSRVYYVFVRISVIPVQRNVRRICVIPRGGAGSRNSSDSILSAIKDSRGKGFPTVYPYGSRTVDFVNPRVANGRWEMRRSTARVLSPLSRDRPAPITPEEGQLRLSRYSNTAFPRRVDSVLLSFHGHGRKRYNGASIVERLLVTDD